MAHLSRECSLNPETGKLTLTTNLYANVVLNFGWGDGVIPIPYSHVVWFFTHGRWPHEDNQIHHLNNDSIDNRPVNLSEQSVPDHGKFRRGRIVNRNYGKNSKYGYGITLNHDKRDNRYYVRRYLSRGHGNGELRTINRSMGGYDSLAEAEARIEYLIEQIKEHGLAWLPDAPEKNPKRRTLEILQHRNSVRRRRAAGETIAQIAKNTGLTESNVYSLIKDMGVDKRKNRMVGGKLTAEDVLAIRAKRAKGQMIKDLAVGYGTSVETISQICLRKTWTHI